MNEDYDVAILDKQKLKLEKMIEEFGGLLTENLNEIKPVIQKQWNENFKDLISVVRETGIGKKVEVKQNIQRVYKSKDLK